CTNNNKYYSPIDNNDNCYNQNNIHSHVKQNTSFLNLNQLDLSILLEDVDVISPIYDKPNKNLNTQSFQQINQNTTNNNEIQNNLLNNSDINEENIDFI